MIMIVTSYFAKYKKDNGVSIALSPPSWFKGITFHELNPTWDMLVKYKNDGDEQAYREAYHTLILSKLDPQQVFDKLNGKVLLCWEKAGVFCHRRIVAEWLSTALNIDVPEL